MAVRPVGAPQVGTRPLNARGEIVAAAHLVLCFGLAQYEDYMSSSGFAETRSRSFIRRGTPSFLYHCNCLFV
jgi:hypothetical protein